MGSVRERDERHHLESLHAAQAAKTPEQLAQERAARLYQNAQKIQAQKMGLMLFNGATDDEMNVVKTRLLAKRKTLDDVDVINVEIMGLRVEVEQELNKVTAHDGS